LVIDGPINGDWFIAYVEQLLGRRHRYHGQSRLSQGRRGGSAIEAKGATLTYLPPYSPDLNPIEQVFAKLKSLLRKAAARSIEAMWDVIGQLLKAFSPQECANYLVI